MVACQIYVLADCHLSFESFKLSLTSPAGPDCYDQICEERYAVDRLECCTVNEFIGSLHVVCIHDIKVDNCLQAFFTYSSIELRCQSCRGAGRQPHGVERELKVLEEAVSLGRCGLYDVSG